MPEIRINSKPCPSCNHRNVTAELLTCERCGSPLKQNPFASIIVGSLFGLALLIGGGVFILNRIDRIEAQNAVTPAAPAKELPSPIVPPRKDSAIKKTPDPENQKPFYITAASDGRQQTPPEYQHLTEYGKLLVSDLPVRVESLPISAYENQALQQLAQLLSQSDYQGKHIFVVGFAESVGSEFIAQQRAEFARKVLAEKYLVQQPITAMGIGPGENQITDRKTEVWVQ